MEDGVWRTIGGRRVYIKKGQSVSDAMKESGKFKKNESKKETPKVKSDDKKDKYLSRGEMGDLIDKWSSEGFEEGKYRSEYGKGVFHEKYASGQLTGYGGEEDDFVIEGFDLGSAPEKEALEDLNDILGEYGYKAEYLKEGTVHQDIKISKIKGEGLETKPGRTTEQINKEYEDLSKKMQQDDYYYKPEDDRKLKELRAEYDTEVARGQEDVNLKNYKEKEAREKEFEKSVNEGYEKFHGKTDKEIADAKDDLKRKYMEIPEEERVRAYEEGKTWGELVKENLDLSKENDRFLAKAQALHDKETGKLNDEEYNKKLKEIDSHAGEKSKEEYNQYSEYYKKEKLGEPSNYNKGDTIEYQSGYGEKIKGTIVREATKEEKQDHINTNLKGYIVRDVLGNESVVADTKITKGSNGDINDELKAQVKRRIWAEKTLYDQYNYSDRNGKKELTNNFNKELRKQNELEKKYGKISEEDFKKMRSDIYKESEDYKKQQSKTMNDKIRDEAFRKYKKEHPGSKITLSDFLKKK